MSELILSRVGYVYYGPIPVETVFEYIEELTGAVGGEGRFEAQFPRDANGDFQMFGYICWHSANTAQKIFKQHNSFIADFEGEKYKVTITPCKFRIPNGATNNTIQSAGSVPHWIGEEELRQHFERYSTGNYFKCKIVNERGGLRRAVIHYDRMTEDAYSALVLCKISYFERGNNEVKVFFELQRKR